LATCDVGSVRSLYVGGQRLNPETARRARAVFGSAIHQMYGMAEGLICCTRRGDSEDVVVGTQGRPLSEADELRVVDESGGEVARGHVGELETRGPYTIRGYQWAPQLNRLAFSADGFYRTGDHVRLHPSGNVQVEGRRKDQINRGGEKVAADELEALILEHPLVSNAAVVPFPDAVLGERICAFVILRGAATLTLTDLVAFLRDEKKISPTCFPERLVLRDALPLTPVGKIAKARLREEARRMAADESGSQPM
jgi:non-ribosomal peptide synthetase component E (peptide arylation enzyme)